MNCAHKVKRSKVKKSNYFLAILLTALSGLVFYSAHLPLPSEKAPVQWYVAESSDDLAQLLQKAIAKAKHSVFLRAFTLQDPHLLRLLEKKQKAQVQIDALCDGRYNGQLPSFIQKVSGKGLFHRKVLIIDDTEVYLGSANFTTSSLIDQANHIAAFHDPKLAAFLKGGCGVFRNGDLEIYTLPSAAALKRLIETIDTAKSSIDLALFTLSHPSLLDALERAEKRGLCVRVIFDSSGAFRSKQLTRRWIWRGGALMHHKFALFDGETVAFGSANWTKSAFEKNDDILAFMPAPTKAKELFERLLQKSVPAS